MKTDSVLFPCTLPIISEPINKRPIAKHGQPGSDTFHTTCCFHGPMLPALWEPMGKYTATLPYNTNIWQIVVQYG
jgi:hypothetical protein